MLTTKSYEPEKIFLIFEKEGNTPKKSRYLNENHTLGFSISENLTVEISSSYLQ